jgi:arylsulfatase A-like enzyme
MIRTDRYKYVVYETGARREQLFDIQEDPGELVDLSEHAGHRDVLADLRETLYERCVATGDTSDTWVIPGTEGFPGHVDTDTAQRR